MRLTTYRALQWVAASLCLVSTLTLSETLTVQKPTSLSAALMGVGLADWLAVLLVSLSFGLISLLQRFRNSEAGDKYVLFVVAHMSGSLASGVTIYMLSQSALDSPNRFAQALAIGAAGWGGSKVADYWAAKLNKVDANV